MMADNWPIGEAREYLWVAPDEIPARLIEGWMFGVSVLAPCHHHRYARLMWREIG